MYCPNTVNNSPCGGFQINVLPEHFEFASNRILFYFIMSGMKKKILERIPFLCILKILGTHTANHTTITVLFHTHRVLPYIAALTPLMAGWLAG
jgi:hypothetical protein